MEKCYYCNKPAESKEHFYTHTMYQVISINKFITGYKFNYRDILVPRCESCYKRHTKFNLTFFLPAFIILLCVVFYLFYTNPKNENTELWKWVVIFIISSIISSFIAAIFSNFMEYLFFERIYKTRKQEDIKEFEPIKKLLLLNWQFHKKDPAVASIEHIAKDSPFYKSK
jgi:hypothetical protein